MNEIAVEGEKTRGENEGEKTRNDPRSIEMKNIKTFLSSINYLPGHVRMNLLKIFLQGVI